MKDTTLALAVQVGAALALLEQDRAGAVRTIEAALVVAVDPTTRCAFEALLEEDEHALINAMSRGRTAPAT